MLVLVLRDSKGERRILCLSFLVSLAIIADLMLASSAADLPMVDIDPRCLYEETNLRSCVTMPVATGYVLSAMHSCFSAALLPLPAKYTMASVLPALKLRVKPYVANTLYAKDAIAAVRDTISPAGADEGMTRSSW